MLGMIARCLEEMVISHFGSKQWEQVRESTGLEQNWTVAATDEVNDEIIYSLFENAGQLLEMDFVQMCDLFGEYWVNAYAPRIYRLYFNRSKTARDFLMQLNAMHTTTTADIANSSPPTFNFEWQDDKNLLIYYHSHRRLIHLAAGLIRGVGKRYHEDIEVTVIKPECLKIRFP